MILLGKLINCLQLEFTENFISVNILFTNSARQDRGRADRKIKPLSADSSALLDFIL